MYITSEEKTKPPYVPGLEGWSLYKDIWIKHSKDFLEIYDERFRHEYGPLDDWKVFEIEKLIDCGDYRNGFEKHKCQNCLLEFIVPFSCKSRLCLSCYRKRLFGWSMRLSSKMNPELSHTHVTFTMPKNLSELLFSRKFDDSRLIKLSAGIYKREIMRKAGVIGSEWQTGIVTTLHRAGNGLTENLHAHLISTRCLINSETGEKIDVPFLLYSRMRKIWMKAPCRVLVRAKILTSEESEKIRKKYKDGFHVYFQPMANLDENDLLFRTAEYIADGYFHNSQILKVNHEKMEITFKYKAWVDRKTRKKTFSVKTMDIYEFMARMLYFLPEKHSKTLRYYGIYAAAKKSTAYKKTCCTWAKAIEHSFNKKPIQCPKCDTEMNKTVHYSWSASFILKQLKKTHTLVDGYFVPNRSP